MDMPEENSDLKKFSIDNNSDAFQKILGGKKYRKHRSKKHRSKKHRSKKRHHTRKHNKSKKMNYLTFCKKYAQKHGLPNARAAMSNPNCKRAFHAIKH